MYWQVYMHKTTVSTEQMLIQLIRRARTLVQSGHTVEATPAFALFLKKEVTIDDFGQQPETYLSAFAALDDYDIWGSIKVWVQHADRVLSMLSRMLLERKLFKVELENEKIAKTRVRQIREEVMQQLHLDRQETKYLCTHGSLTNSGYIPDDQNILIKKKTGEILDVAAASDLPNIKALSKIVKKYYLCYPKFLSLKP